MNPGIRLSRAALLGALVSLAACESDPEPAPPALDVVFADNYGPGVRFEAFSGVPTTATVAIDMAVKRTGTASLRLEVPATAFAGGAFPTETPRNLSGFNALTFWVRASQAATLNEIGLGNDNTGAVPFIATRRDIPVTTDWTRVVMPIPDPAKLVAEAGLLYFAEGSDEGAYTLWLDDVKFEALPASELALASAELRTETATRGVGETAQVGGTKATFTVGGEAIEVEAAPRYFTFASSAPAVATVAADGLVSAVALGTAEITGTLGAADAEGALTLEVVDGNSPMVAAPTPDEPAADVISLFSDAYTPAGDATWSTSWDSADVSDVSIGGSAAKKYENLVFAGIEPSAPIDATAMTHFHLDVWTPDVTTLKVKLVDFGANGAFGGGDDTEHELVFDAASTPALAQRTWVSLDLPLSRFANMTARGHVAQLILVGEKTGGGATTAYVDNVYFYAGEEPPPPTAPPAAAPTPGAAAADVISLFSDAYTPAADATWSTSWDSADVSDVSIGGDAAKKYENLVFAGIEPSAPIDATEMTHFHLDVWTPDATTLKVKLVDFGADGAFGGGDNSEHELVFDAATTPALAQGAWVSLDIPLSSFTSMTARAHVAQLILVGLPASGTGVTTAFVDNVYFHK
jgi:hypothetical protein